MRHLDEIRYEHETGNFYWREAKQGRSLDKPIGQKTEYGYVRIRLADGKRYMAHRLAWRVMTGRWPAEFIDHINGNRADNKWINLREATKTENNRNRKASGFERRTKNSYRARITVNGKELTIGHFRSADEAKQAYRRAKALFHGEFAP